MFSGDALPLQVLKYNSDSNEEDIRISETQATRILIYSPDTDIYNIGVKFLTKMLFCSIMCYIPLFVLTCTLIT